jgi:hypothetical protein
MASTECLPGLSTENKSTSARGRHSVFRAVPFTRINNNGSRDVKALCGITPAAIGPQYFRESAEVINAAAGGPPDRTKMADIMRRHGLTLAPPPARAQSLGRVRRENIPTGSCRLFSGVPKAMGPA